jgi:predicted ABC-type ATPase
MVERLSELVQRQESFSFETTLSGRSYVRFLRECHHVGYRIYLDFLWVPELQLTRLRVAQRMMKGGHNIPIDIQERRFLVGLKNLFSLYRPFIHHWRIFDNSDTEPVCTAEEF